MARIKWTKQATQDLIDIADFIAKDSVKYAKITILKIRETTKQLEKFPLSGRKVPEIDNDSIRELILGNYRIIYSVFVDDTIEILTVHHAAKRLIT